MEYLPLNTAHYLVQHKEITLHQMCIYGPGTVGLTLFSLFVDIQLPFKRPISSSCEERPPLVNTDFKEFSKH